MSKKPQMAPEQSFVLRCCSDKIADEIASDMLTHLLQAHQMQLTIALELTKLMFSEKKAQKSGDTDAVLTAFERAYEAVNRHSSLANMVEKCVNIGNY